MGPDDSFCLDRGNVPHCNDIPDLYLEMDDRATGNSIGEPIHFRRTPIHPPKMVADRRIVTSVKTPLLTPLENGNST